MRIIEALAIGGALTLGYLFGALASHIADERCLNSLGTSQSCNANFLTAPLYLLVSD